MTKGRTIKPNCGNFISAVPIFAIYKKLVDLTWPTTIVRIFNENTKQIIHAHVPTTKDGVNSSGNTILDGVTGSFAPIELNFFNVVGFQTGKLLPTSHPVDLIDEVRVSCVDVSVPMVIINGEDLGIDRESDLEIFKKHTFLEKLQLIRQKAVKLMGLGDVSNSVIPKLTIVCKSETHDIKSYYYDPFILHDTHAVTGGMCLAAACLIKGTVANLVSNKRAVNGKNLLKIEHQHGGLDCIIDFDSYTNQVNSASFIRTASILMDGIAFI